MRGLCSVALFCKCCSSESGPFKHFNSLCKVNGVLRNFVNAVVSQKISFFGKCIKILWIIYKKLKSVSLKWSSLFKYFYSLCEKNEVWLYYENAVVTDKIPFFWKWFKILWRIHEKLTCVFLNEKNSIQTFQFTLWSEWSVKLLFKSCNFREITLFCKCIKILWSIP